jgi:cytochrome c-type biogenesis protein CcmH/NrfF
MKRTLFVWLGLSVVLLLASAVSTAPGYAQDGGETYPQGVEAEEVNAIASQLSCASCSGASLAECTTAQCAAWRQDIANLLADDRPPSYIYRYFAENETEEFKDSFVRGQYGDLYPPGVEPAKVYDIAEEMYCDVCEGEALAYCRSGQCQNWREEISDLLAEGRSEDEIRREFSIRYGDKVSAIPVDDEDRFLTFAIPIVLVAVAGLGVGLQIYRWRRRETRAQQAARAAGTLENFERPVPDNVDPVYLERLLELLENRKS